MNLSDYIDGERVILSLSSQDKDSAISEMVNFLDGKNALTDRESALQALFEREKLGSTGVGEEIAIPHAKLAVDDLVILLAFSDGLPFQSADGKDVKILFLVLAPEKQMNLHLKTLAKISRLVKATDFKERVLQAKSVSDVCLILREEEEKL
ncbi:MAG: PTS sugar transporter subunit IIA [Geovibrio sp.]|jgi:PTS system nitrogen regulatory IIA component|uniref:PTS sugar transporter subunit IIA n=1 Tax=Geovibrio ferrireducens TaxID=46201 RepID=UPI002247FA64|nr:PTS sugar transporter subunit IIA [Geovibrio ferrireducens]MCD8569459.1 PTS sugar transporter subunit IIA [Geovibrio sp.]